MIISTCPYDGCDGLLMTPICEHPPKFEKRDCDECGRVVWVYHSRMAPSSFTEQGFAELYNINEATRVITPKSAGNV